tara:strand:- start:1537 stop:2976 length:1440 start_codon:yes stop_codon:yes gene_type:complete
MSDVEFQRSDFSNALADWQLVSDVCEGQRKVKSKREQYLPLLNGDDRSTEAITRYDRYLERAVFYNATGRTLEGLVGAVFKKEPVLKTPASLEYIKSSVDGQGISIAQQSKDTIAEVLKKGRHALYVDYPPTDGAVTAKQRESGEFNATIRSIRASNVVNWQTTQRGSKTVLSLVVIKEASEEVTTDGFGTNEIDQYRVLRLFQGIYIVEVWRKDDSGDWIIDDMYQPTNGKGKPWNEIPFTFVGAENNDSVIDKAPLLDLANLNIAHYRNSADYEDSAFFVGQVQPYITELDDEWRDWLQKQGIVIGSRNPILLPKGSTFGYAQALPNMISFEAMKHKEDQMKSLGARLLEKGLAVKTATQSNSESASEHSVLSLVVSNVEEAYWQCLLWVAEFMNTSEAIEFEINKEFIDHNLDPQILTALVSAWQTGKLVSQQDIWKYLKKTGVIDSEKTDDEIEEELDNDDAGLGLDDDVNSKVA